MDNEIKEFENNTNDENFDLISMSSSSRRFKKKKRGIAGFFSRIGDRIANWWNSLKKWQKITVTTLSSFVAVILVAVIFLFSYFNYNYNNITNNPDDLGFENVINEKVVNIALFGLDTRNVNAFKGNSDSIMILSINTETKKVKIVSIMRDSLVPIENGGKTYFRKINSAYASGGPELAIKTINRNFGLDISEYATVNFFGMVDIIDAVGGIDAELTQGEVLPASSSQYALNGCIKNICKSLKISPDKYYITTPGKHHLNGIQAVAYSRIRRFMNIWGTTDDFGRTDRQRYVMEQLFNKALTLEKSQYIKLAKSLIPCSETSLSYKEIMGLAFDVLLKSPTFEQTRMPLSEYQMKAPYNPMIGSCVYYDLDFAKNLLHAFFYDDITPEQYVETNGIAKNDWYAQMGGTSYTPNKNPSSSSSGSSSTSKPDKTSSESSGSEQVSSSEPTDSSSETSTSDETGTSSDSETTGSSTDGSSSVSSTESSTPSQPTDSTVTTPSDSSSENTTP